MNKIEIKLREIRNLKKFNDTMQPIMKKLKNLPNLIILVAVATYIGFGPLMEFSESGMAKHFLSAGFGAIFIAFITLFLMEQQSKNEEKREKESKIFEEKLASFKNLLTTLREIMKKNRDTKSILSKEDLERIIFDISEIRMHCGVAAVDKISTSLYEIFYDEREGTINAKVDELKLIEKLFELVERLNLELFPDAESTETEKHKNQLHLSQVLEEFKQLTTGLNDITNPRSGNKKKTLASGPTVYFANTRGRDWADLREYGFWQGGRREKINNNIEKMVPGDIVCAYMSGKGYLGVGKVLKKGVVGSEWKKDTKLFESLSPFTKKQIEDGEAPDAEAEEMFVKVDWTNDTVISVEANPLKSSGLFASPMTVCRLNHEPTIDAVKNRFGWP